MLLGLQQGAILSPYMFTFFLNDPLYVLCGRPPPCPSGLRAWDSLFTMKHGMREVVGSIPQPGQYTRGVFHPARLNSW